MNVTDSPRDPNGWSRVLLQPPRPESTSDTERQVTARPFAPVFLPPGVSPGGMHGGFSLDGNGHGDTGDVQDDRVLAVKRLLVFWKPCHTRALFSGKRSCSVVMWNPPGITNPYRGLAFTELSHSIMIFE